ncbi:undecaprenyl-phosphate glucose phosphotransferase [Synechococcus sp. CS-1325]|uniref:undecaprenyl-phosphate glucose phosphotransferase n=1 Tax=unclassified Synechococcus TaxID=2626047 RepID=UPI0021A2A001|nr:MULTISPECIES: undecaprenyl-phosphate glucose phosphotransferase [unclassified Synechococcus]MCT0200806.1 undecaprenyl-phosphate glucose phosphotransferase [Synechococcus sp. CS-1325]MCT0213845.1 undecaprenyl-phosphate glucose phosphotransferase [Synechococcus sp. CS-1326]MCT0233421.1 undecaprenyl-phosphate glucose phosphotransferase [Synechococcus sp. CS-1327]
MKSSGLLRLYSKDLNRIQRWLDPLVIGESFLLLSWWNSQFEIRQGGLDHQAGILILVVSFIVLSQGNIYQSYRQQSLLLLLRRLLLSWVAMITILLLIAFLTKTSENFSRLTVSVWSLFSLGWLLFCHLWGRHLLRKHRAKGGNSRNVIYWGPAATACSFHAQLLAQPHLGLRLVAWFESPSAETTLLPKSMPASMGGLSELRRWLEFNTADQIYFSYSPDRRSSHLSMAEVIRFFGDTCLPVYYVPHWAQEGMRFNVERLGSQLVFGLWVPPEANLDRQAKRVIDLVGSLVLLVALSPLLILIAVLIPLTSPGPILFSQERYGFKGKRFRILKFRTMTVMEAGDQAGLVQATRHDPRITPLGAYLRRWSLDELPQLINVLKGEMSLVGPRPHAVDHNELYRTQITAFMQRHQFKPGMTGLAQVEGWRGETATLQSMASRIEADLRYQRDWSLRLDVKILLRTVFGLSSPNAY